MKLSKLLMEQGISLEASLDFLSDGLIIINTRVEILFVNQAARVICGMSPEGHYTTWPNYLGVYESDRMTVYNPDNLPIVRAYRGETVVDEHLFLKKTIS